MKRVALVPVVILVGLMGAPCLAKKGPAPLHPKILAAKTVYLENHGSAKLAGKAYDELKKWGRWEMVEDRTKADLVIIVSLEKGQSSGGTTSTYDPSKANSPTGGWTYGTTTSSSPDSVHLELVDSKTGQTIYTDMGGTAHGIIKELRKRIEEQKKPSKDK